MSIVRLQKLLCPWDIYKTNCNNEHTNIATCSGYKHDLFPEFHHKLDKNAKIGSHHRIHLEYVKTFGERKIQDFPKKTEK